MPRERPGCARGTVGRPGTPMSRVARPAPLEAALYRDITAGPHGPRACLGSLREDLRRLKGLPNYHLDTSIPAESRSLALREPPCRGKAAPLAKGESGIWNLLQLGYLAIHGSLVGCGGLYSRVLPGVTSYGKRGL